MNIPAYWSRATAEDVDRNGRKATFSCWRSSERSPEDARGSALAAAGCRVKAEKQVHLTVQPPRRSLGRIYAGRRQFERA